jgi:hypothetical protein
LQHIKVSSHPNKQQREASVARIEVRVSDLSEELIRNADEAITIAVEHPEYPETITLDAIAQDLEGKLPDPKGFVAITYNNQRYILTTDDFNALFTGENGPEDILERAFREQHPRSRRRGRQSKQQRRRSRVDYASPEHAGEPHAGRVSPAEQKYVREHLDEVNARLREQGIREIDPTDPDMAERYGLVQEPIEEAEVIEERP